MELDIYALPVVLLSAWLWFFYRPSLNLHKFPYFAISSLEGGLSSSKGQIASKLLLASFFFFSAAFLDIRVEAPILIPPSSNAPPKEGIAIYLMVDQSGSMMEKRGNETKLDLMKRVVGQFINSRPNDLLGLIAFARGADVLSPLTLDHKTLADALASLKVVPSQDLDGTSLGYAIFKTTQLIAAAKLFAQDLKGEGKPAYEIKNTIMVLVTDGVQDPNPLDEGKQWRNIEVVDAAKYAEQQGIRLYAINIDPEILKAEFAPHRRLMQKAVDMTGGKFYVVDREQTLQRVFADIDQIERSKLPNPVIALPKAGTVRLFSLSPYLIAIGIALLLGAIVMETISFRVVP